MINYSRQIAAVTFASALLVAGAAQAKHDERPRELNVREIAHELERATRALHKQAEKTAHHPSHREEWALRRFHVLEERAEHFHRRVERDYRQASHTYDDYLELRDAFARSRWAMPALHATGGVEREMNRVAALMRELEAYYRPVARNRYSTRHDDGVWRTRSGIRFRLWR